MINVCSSSYDMGRLKEFQVRVEWRLVYQETSFTFYVQTPPWHTTTEGAFHLNILMTFRG